MKYYVRVNGREHEVELLERLGETSVLVDGEPLDVEYHDADLLGQVLVLAEGRSFGVSVEGDAQKVGVTIAGHFYDVAIEDERERAAHAAAREAAKGGGVVVSVMPGVVVEVLVEEGQSVAEGEPLLILEAMKMQNEIAAPADGLVAKLHVTAGRAVASGERLVTMAAPAEE